MKYILFIFAIIFILIPISVFAICSDTGATVVYVNGVKNSQKDADRSKFRLEQNFQEKFNDTDIKFITGYNPSHLAGAGDILQSAAQMLDSSISDYDLNTILMQIEPEVKTQKILLVGHSQGTFYTNALYQYLVTHGVQKESIAVYNIATPASEVVAGGGYLTSSNDSAVLSIAEFAKKLQILLPMSANIIIPIYPDDTGSDYPGHDFIRAYIAGAADKIISDVSHALSALTVKANAETSENCFTTPEPTMSYRIQSIVFVPFDFITDIGSVAFGAIKKEAYQTGLALVNGVTSAAKTLASVFTTSSKQQTGAIAETTTSNTFNEGKPSDGGLASVDEKTLAAVSSKSLLALEQKVMLAERQTKVLVATLANISSAENTPHNTNANQNQNKNSDGEYVGGSLDAPIDVVDTSTNKVAPVTSPSSGFGGGGDATLQPAISSAETTQTDTTPPSAPALIAPADFLRTFTSASISFSGTAEAGSVISTDVSSATTTTNQSGEWALSLTFNQGTTTAQFFATDTAGNISAATSTTLFVDSFAPQTPAPIIAECANSLAVSGCLVATTTLSVSWSASEESDFSHFVINNNGTISTTTATSTSATATDNTTYSFALAAIDTSGNASATTTITAEINTSPVVINEVAWGGTNASTADEWVELYNKTASAVNLSGWTLYAADGAPYIPLSGHIAAGGYYLIERKNTGETDEATQSSIKDITADLWTSFGSGISNTGENLILAWKSESSATTTIDEISYCYVWCANGSGSPDFRSMERYDVSVLGTDWANWGSNQVIVRNGTDADGNTLNATPKAYNSFSRLLNKGNTTITQDMTLKKSKSPYVVNNTIVTMQAGKTLTLEPGTIIKFYNYARLAVLGTIDAQGTENDPIVFTSLHDDTYGGDTNQNGSGTIPTKGDWYGVELAAGSDASVFDHAIFRYGGKYVTGVGLPSANLYLDHTSPSINHGTFEYGGQHGIRLLNSNSTISNSIIQHNGSGYWMGGITINGGAPTIENNQFSDNVIGIYLASSEARVSSNTIASSTSEAIYTSGVIGDGYFSGNSGSNNAWNGVALAGDITKAGVTTTLKQNSFPYLIKQSSDVTIVASSTLAIDTGVTIKFRDQRLFVNGDLSVAGTGANPIIFTSVYDDSDGNDASNGSGNSSGVAGNIQGTILQSGSTSNISGAVFKFMKTALSYVNSPITLSDTVFSDNTLVVSADTATKNNYPITASNITFTNNTATTSPIGLW